MLVNEYKQGSGKNQKIFEKPVDIYDGI